MDPQKVLTGPCTFQSLTPCNLSTCTKRQILEFFENSYSLNESIFTTVSCEEAFYKCPDRLRLPLIFYYGHTAAVYINKLMLAGLIKKRVNLEYETMFETGVDEMSWDDTENYRMGGSYLWPHLDKVVEFRAEVRQLIRRAIQETPLEVPVTQDSPWWAVFMGMDHERIHVETSSVLIRQLPVHMVHRPMGWTIAPRLQGDGVNKNPLIPVEETEVCLGKPSDFPTYGWDNEYPEIKKRVPSFEAAAYLTTNKQFLHFVNTGGYKNKEWWTKEGWNWCTYRKAQHPVFWVCQDGCTSNIGAELAGYSHCKPQNNNQEENRNHQTNGNHQINGNGTSKCNTDDVNIKELIDKYRLRTICEEVEMPWDWPVVINYHEAKAYCNWLGHGYRLLTEAEHHAIRNPEPSSKEGASAEFSLSADLDKKHNLNLHYGSSTPVNMYPPTESGFYDVFGNVWEWTEDHFNGLPGFKTHSFYDDFSTPTFDGHHNVIMGGSWVSSGTQAARFGRYAFRRHFYQHAGFRIARTVNAAEDPPIALVQDVKFPEDQEISVSLQDVNKHMLPSTNTQLHLENHEYLNRQLHKEYNTAGNNFKQTLLAACIEIMQRHGASFNKGVDLGCGCGSLTFELTNHFQEVIGSDVCGQFIDSAEQLRENGRMCYHEPTFTDSPTVAKQQKFNEDAEILEASVPGQYDRAKVNFKQFTWIPNELSNFDLVVLHDLDRLQNKKAWMLRLNEIIVPTGLVIIVCTDDWTEKDMLPIVEDRLKLLESKKMQFNEDGHETSAVLTIWRRL